MREKIEEFYVKIDSILLARKFVIETSGTVNYSDGRKMFGLVCVTGGKAVFHMNSGIDYLIKAGDIALISEHSAYTVEVFDRYVHYTVNFIIDIKNCIGQSVVNFIESDRIIVMKPNIFSSYEKVFSELCAAWRSKQLGYSMTAVMLTYSLLKNFLVENLLIGIDAASYNKVLPAKEYLDKNYSNSISISELADICGMSKTSFRRTFVNVFGKTAFEYRDMLRILLAKDYLLGNIYTIAEISEKCGFSDINYFSRFFKKHTGVCPTKYRLMY